MCLCVCVSKNACVLMDFLEAQMSASIPWCVCMCVNLHGGRNADVLTAKVAVTAPTIPHFIFCKVLYVFVFV